MASFQLKGKDVTSYFYTFSFSYCEIAEVTRLLETVGCHRLGYTAGVYGWNSDIYVLPFGIALSTGYRPVGKYVKGLSEQLNAYAKMWRNHELTAEEAYQHVFSDLKAQRWHDILIKEKRGGK